MAVRGIARVKANFKAELKRISEQTTERTVYEIISQGAALAATRVPIDSGNLINSNFIDIDVQAGKVVGRTGYTAAYAEHVHEATGILKGMPRPGNRGDYWDPSGEPEFLEKGFEELEPHIPAILQRNYRN